MFSHSFQNSNIMVKYLFLASSGIVLGFLLSLTVSYLYAVIALKILALSFLASTMINQQKVLSPCLPTEEHNSASLDASDKTSLISALHSKNS